MRRSIIFMILFLILYSVMRTYRSGKTESIKKSIPEKNNKPSGKRNTVFKEGQKQCENYIKIKMKNKEKITDIVKKVDMALGDLNKYSDHSYQDMEDQLIALEGFFEEYPRLIIENFRLVEYGFLIAASLGHEDTSQFLEYLKKFHKKKFERKCYTFYLGLKIKSFNQLKSIVDECLYMKKDPMVIVDWIGVVIGKMGMERGRVLYREYLKKYNQLPMENKIFPLKK